MKKTKNQDEQLSMFDNFGMIFTVEEFIESGNRFTEKALLLFLDLPEPLTADHVLKYLALGYELPESAQLKLFTKPELQNGTSEFYLLDHELAPNVQQALLTSNEHIAKRYLSMHISEKTADKYISPEFLKKAKELHWVSEDVQSEWNSEVPVAEYEMETHW